MDNLLFVRSLGENTKLRLCSRDVRKGEYFSQVGIDKLHPTARFLCTDIIERDGNIYLKDDEEHSYVVYNKDYPNTLLCYKIVGTVSPGAKWVKDGDYIKEEDTSYSQVKQDLIEKLRLEFEERTGFKIGSWVKDSEDGYKKRYQGQIYQYDVVGGELQILYGSANGGSYGYERHILACTEEQIAANAPYQGHYGYGQYLNIDNLIRVKCGQCDTFH